MTAPSLAAALERGLKAAGAAERAAHEKGYLKSELDHYGVPVPEIRRQTRAAVRREGLDREASLALADELWERPVHECRAAAVEILVLRAAELGPGELSLVESRVREARTWALVDNLAVKVAGVIVERHPGSGSVLDRWAEDEDFWVRRSAVLALLLPLRRGEGDFERFSRYADSMLEEKEFFVRKAIGWVLREVSKQDPDCVASWLRSRTQRISGVTIREALRYLSPEVAENLLASYRTGR